MIACSRSPIIMDGRLRKTVPCNTESPLKWDNEAMGQVKFIRKIKSVRRCCWSSCPCPATLPKGGDNQLQAKLLCHFVLLWPCNRDSSQPLSSFLIWSCNQRRPRAIGPVIPIPLAERIESPQHPFELIYLLCTLASPRDIPGGRTGERNGKSPRWGSVNPFLLLGHVNSPTTITIDIT